MQDPTIIQGGMGAGVSGWPLARAVAAAGQLGVVSGTALDVILARRLQDGDAGGHLRRALAHFPDPAVAQRILARWFQPDGRPAGRPYLPHSLHSLESPRFLTELTVAANFVEIWLAREGLTAAPSAASAERRGAIGVNYLEKIQLPNLASLYGAMLAGVDYVLVGAGLPHEFPAAIDCLAAHRPATLTLDVKQPAGGAVFRARFDPAEILSALPPPLARPRFLAIVGSSALASVLVRKVPQGIDGFVVEHNSAGGHNAPPRGALRLTEAGEPVYGPRDEPRLEELRDLGRPFWLAGSYGRPERLQEALDQGAAGIQVGTAFAFCRESGLAPDLRRRVLQAVLDGKAQVFTDPNASPTGFPFKVVNLPGTMADPEIAAARERRCDLGYLRQLYLDPKGCVTGRCPGEPGPAYLAKGGHIEETVGRKCLCNGLLANIGLAQRHPDGYLELPILTAGDTLSELRRFVTPDRLDYSADDVLAFLLSPANQAHDSTRQATSAPAVTD
ncbi:MAG: nitronate monooxygenase [Planctomycetota bacterium]